MAGSVYRLYYSCIQWITGIEAGPDGQPWYVIQDEADKNLSYYVPAKHLRPISPDEFTPLSPNVPTGKNASTST